MEVLPPVALPVDADFFVSVTDDELLPLVPVFVSADGLWVPDFTEVDFAPAETFLELDFAADEAVLPADDVFEEVLVPALDEFPDEDSGVFDAEFPVPAGLPLPAVVADDFFVPVPVLLVLVPALDFVSLSLLEFCFVAIINRSFSSC